MSDLALAFQDLQAGRLERAEEHCRRLLRTEPADADALSLLAVVCAQSGRLDEAIGFATQAIAARPGDSRLFFNRAALHMALERRDRAEADYREAARLDPANLPAHINLGRLMLDDDRLDEARACFESLVSSHPGLPEAHECLGIVHQRQGRDELAIAAFRQALHLAPGHPRIEANLGWSLLECGEADAAAEHLRRVTAAQPGSSDHWVSLGASLMRAGRWSEAEPALDRALALDPAHTRGLAFKAMILDELGRPAGRKRIVDLDTMLWQRRYDRGPAGFPDLAAFNDALFRHVIGHRTLVRGRPGKTTRKGSQTGELLDHDPGPVAALADMIKAAVEEFARGAAAGRRPARWRLRMWGTVLGSSGHQDPHHHPSGWISGVYYVRIPAEIDAGPAGWIEFGRPDPFFGATATTDMRSIRPEEGLMLLFPSYIWHRTIPFTGDRPRVSIAFDLVPLERGR
jgi:Flp pilus assembly protein TadD